MSSGDTELVRDATLLPLTPMRGFLRHSVLRCRWNLWQDGFRGVLPLRHTLMNAVDSVRRSEME
jgi:hypothetical protein